VLETDQKLQPWFSLVLWVFGSEKVHPAGRQFTLVRTKYTFHFSMKKIISGFFAEN
jgi:hypothetical protein